MVTAEDVQFWVDEFEDESLRGEQERFTREVGAEIEENCLRLMKEAAKCRLAICNGEKPIAFGAFDRDEIERNPARSPDAVAAEKMAQLVKEAAQNKDSVGGIVRCSVTGVPAGWGEPVFDKLDALLAHAMLSLGGVKGIEFGAGFAAAGLRGSENNDPLYPGSELYKSNFAGGISGGISNGNTIEFAVAVKPVPSIARSQNTIDDEGNARSIEIHGRHDPCIVPRIVPSLF